MTMVMPFSSNGRKGKGSESGLTIMIIAEWGNYRQGACYSWRLPGVAV